MKFLRAFLFVLLSVTAFAAGLPTFAQDGQKEGEDDKSYLTRLLQDSLSGAGRNIDITGFEGALSSRATMAKLTIADSEGIWLEIDDVIFDWSRSALFSARLEINELSAGKVTVFRPPVADPSLPTPEATPFTIPELPVSVQIGKLAIDRVELGETVLGQPVVMQVNGKASLDGGGLDVALETTRIDGKDGKIDLAARYAPDTGEAAIDLSMAEGAGGIAATALGIPGAPAVTLTVKGEGPVSDFTARTRLESDGQERITGTVRLSSDDAQPPEWSLAVDLGGDMTPLFAPEMRDFFGTRMQFTAFGRQTSEGDIVLDTFSLDTADLTAGGSFTLAPDGWPQAFDLTAKIADAEGKTVTLPSPGGHTKIRRAVLALSYDAAKSDGWTGSAAVLGYQTPGGQAGALRLSGEGTITRGEEGALGQITAALQAGLEGLRFTDPALSQAVGARLSGKLNALWQDGDPFKITGIDLTGDDYGLTGTTTVNDFESQLKTEFDLALSAQDLSRFAALSGLSLSGAADVTAKGYLAVLSGAFDVDIAGQSRDLALGIAPVDGLLAGEGRVALSASRDDRGIILRRASAQTPAAALAASGTLSSTSGAIDYTAELRSLAALLPGAEGKASASGRVLLKGQTLDGATLTAQIDNQGKPVALPLAEGQDVGFQSGTLTARFSQTDGNQWRLDSSFKDITTPYVSLESFSLAGDGTLAQTAAAGLESIKGRLTAAASGVSGEDARFVRALAPGLRATTDFAYAPGGALDLSNLQLGSGEAALSGDLSLTPDTGETTFTLDLDSGPLGRFSTLTGQNLGGSLRLNASGALTLPGDRFKLDGTMRTQNLSLGLPTLDTILTGQTDLDLSVHRDGGLIMIDKLALANPNATLTAQGSENRIDVTAKLRDIGLLASDFSGPVEGGGTITLSDTGYGLDLAATGPGGTNLRANGAISGQGRADMAITGTAPLGLANVYIAPRRINGSANIDLRLSGPLAPGSLSGQITLANARIIDPTLQIAIENLAGAITVSGGRGSLDLTARASNGGYLAVGGQVDLAPPNQADITITVDRFGLRDAALYDTSVSGAVTLTGPLSGGARISGRLALGPTEIRVPSSGVSALEAIPDIAHIRPPQRVLTTLNRADLSPSGGSASAAEETAPSGPAYPVDLVITAPSRIFIRGRGLDAELGGELRLTGTSDNIIPSGAFELVRGRLDILSQRFELSDGRVTLTGSFDPELYLVATTETESATVTITVSGRPSSPEVTFSSTPELPQDEVISLLIFGRGVSQISALQALELANAVATLAGRGGEGIMAKLRKGFGLDDLDVTQTDDGGTAVRAGKYLSKNIYSDVVVDSDGTSEINLNLDVTPHITLKGSADNNGDTSLGIYYEKDY
ncbi:translocation/assembly module TamB domain-containing protein [Rhodalgimonas zhirmunskyi]|uniref:Translocation/assembly module TamB domain-containing protein n=1 Tax=Rhodalgimonas zhirmunskyi TaxID=2964767 RepID=A0AAJ1X7H9_9RHOB|nr:translocation/assembly module TamB domain-containing protein [Rhodoalgimonas zhirmunskyi]MDQ2095724.1 translocation/assembly module TamB domain-containing protein [Rhodoalgimonas zhirmunskyi]